MLVFSSSQSLNSAGHAPRGRMFDIGPSSVGIARQSTFCMSRRCSAIAMTNWRYNVLNIKNTNELYINDHANLVPNLSQSTTRFQLLAVRRQWKNKLFFAAGRLWDVCPYFVSCISGIVIVHGYVLLPHGPCYSLQVLEIMGRMVGSVSYSDVLGLLYDVKRTVLALWTG